MLKRWLRRSSAAQLPSWRELVKALRKNLVKSGDVADMIVRDHSTVGPPSQDRVMVDGPQMQAPPLNLPSSSWQRPPYQTPSATVSSGYSQPPYNHRPGPQFGGDPTQPLRRTFHPPEYSYPPQSLLQDSSTPWSHTPSYPSYPLHEEQSRSQASWFQCDFERQFEQVSHNCLCPRFVCMYLHT